MLARAIQRGRFDSFDPRSRIPPPAGKSPAGQLAGVFPQHLWKPSLGQVLGCRYVGFKLCSSPSHGPRRPHALVRLLQSSPARPRYTAGIVVSNLIKTEGRGISSSSPQWSRRPVFFSTRKGRLRGFLDAVVQGECTLARALPPQPPSWSSIVNSQGRSSLQHALPKLSL